MASTENICPHPAFATVLVEETGFGSNADFRCAFAQFCGSVGCCLARSSLSPTTLSKLGNRQVTQFLNRLTSAYSYIQANRAHIKANPSSLL
ncbi:MAG: hypothetical protein WC489_00895 [Patescibacteria group bacterium]